MWRRWIDTFREYRPLLSKLAFWGACTAIAVLSLTPLERLPPQLFDWWDKAQHSLAFLVLGCLGVLAYGHYRQLPLAAGLLLFGAAIEITQWYSGWRYGEIADLLADSIGLTIAIAIMAGMAKLDKKELPAEFDAQE